MVPLGSLLATSVARRFIGEDIYTGMEGSSFRPRKVGCKQSCLRLDRARYDKIRQLEEQWCEQSIDDERMRELPQRIDRKPRSSRALSRARQGRPSGRRLRRSATL